MPIVHIHMLEGRNVDQKRELVRSMTEAVVNSVDAPPERVHIVIHEMKRENFAEAGILNSEA
ncbi:MAG: 4-oxalocrotonate tautomerase [Actinobacteria bacterium HGW-Actinobacteria-6]|nr:MAG: 4-oxalocrotonate tautomerase [Actinobacteria bacterium HGW-Actinobacteria-6]